MLGIVGNLYARYSRRAAELLIVPGIALLVPGAVGARSLECAVEPGHGTGRRGRRIRHVPARDRAGRGFAFQQHAGWRACIVVTYDKPRGRNSLRGLPFAQVRMFLSDIGSHVDRQRAYGTTTQGAARYEGWDAALQWAVALLGQMSCAFHRLAGAVQAVQHWREIEEQDREHAAHDDDRQRALRLGADLGRERGRQQAQNGRQAPS